MSNDQSRRHGEERPAIVSPGRTDRRVAANTGTFHEAMRLLVSRCHQNDSQRDRKSGDTRSKRVAEVKEWRGMQLTKFF